MVSVIWVVGIVGVFRMAGVVRMVVVVRMVGVVSMVGVVRTVTLLAKHYFMQIIVGWWSLLLDVRWVLCEYVYLVPTTTTIHKSLVNRLTYGCKPVKITSIL